jgi:enoyl-[acyl-carrier protein] reductase II
MIKNKFYDEIKKAETEGANVIRLKNILGESRTRKGIFEGNLEEGNLK